MKRLLFLILIIVCAGRPFALRAEYVARQEIRYISKEATEVYLVWGINNWQLPPLQWRPEGSFVRDKLLYTPMKKESYGLRTRLALPPNTMVDYVFWISRGPAGKPTDIWDINTAPQKDYHSLVVQDNISLINQKVKIRSKEPVTILDFAIPLLSCSATLFMLLLLLGVLRSGRSFSMNAGAVNLVISAGLVLAMMLVLTRASVVGLGADLYLAPLTFFPKVFWAGFYDVIFVIIFCLCFLLLLKWVRPPLIRRMILVLFSGLSVFSLIAGILNIRVVELLGKPFSYPWFCYSDFLKSSDARSAITANISTAYCLNILLVCVAAVFLTLGFLVAASLLIQKKQAKRMLGSSLICCSLVYVTAGPNAIRKYDWEYQKLANPIVEFAGSMGIFSGTPQLFTMPVNDSLKLQLPPKSALPAVPKLPGVKNVVLIVLESTAAEYVQPYSREFKVTPQLEAQMGEAAIFDNIYAHAPATNNSLVSILGSAYPWLSYNSLTREHPGVPLSTISDELKQLGYRTGFFNSADNRFQKADEFLANRSFDRISDCSTPGCDGFKVQDEKWQFLDGKDDGCTAQGMMDWIGEQKDSAFFAMMWTYQTHYPYFVNGREEKYSADPVQNRYLNAVRHSDEVIGQIIAELKKKGLYESTLVVVVGDHGEAFGRHGQTTHASGIYEENLHVPCVFLNPAFRGMHYKGIGGLVDIAPTIMSCLGHAPAAQWEGKNLFQARYSDRVYFFTPWADYLFGFREGGKKYIFNATRNEERLFDLEKDPVEASNIIDRADAARAVYQQRLAGWVQAVNSIMEQRIAGEKK